MNSKLKTAVISSFLSKNSAYFVQVLSLGITARLFSPQDFGVLATLTLLVQFFFILGEGGIGTALISSEKVTKSIRDCMFTVSAGISLTFTTLFYLFTPFFSDYFLVDYGNTRYILSFAIFFSLLSMVPVAILRRDLLFVLLGKTEVAAEIISLFLILLLWKLGFRLEAIASRLLTIGVFKFFVVFYFTRGTSVGMPRFTKDFRSLNTFLRVSLFQFLYSIVNYISRTSDNFAVGKSFDMYTLGFYDKAYQLMRYPMMLISISISPAIQSVMARGRDDLVGFASTHRNIESKLFLLGCVLSLLFFVNSELIVLIMFGKEWIYVSDILSIFSIAIPFLLLQGISGGFFQALNNTDLLFYLGILSLILNLTAIMIGVYFRSVNYLSYSLVFSYVITYIITHFILYFYVFNIKKTDHSIKMLSMAALYFILCLIFHYFSNYFDFREVKGITFIVMADSIFFIVSILMFNKVLRTS